MIDLHSHVLPGVDDGVRDLASALDLVRAARAEGVTAIAATPHVREDYPTSVEQMESGVAELREAVTEAGIDVTILHGGEIDLEWLPRLEPDELRRFTLGQTGRYLLVELPYAGWPVTLLNTIERLAEGGITALLAHPERNGAVQERPARLAEAIASGALAQVTSASLEGRLGRLARSTGLKLVERGLVHVIASDSHGADLRAFGMSAAASSVGGGPLAEYLTTAAPGAIAAGLTLPPRPRSSRRLFSSLRKRGM